MKKYTKEQKLTGGVVAILIILIIVTVCMYVYAVKTKAALGSFSVDTKNGEFVLKGKRLAGADISIIPTGTNILPSEYQVLESMVPESTSTSVDSDTQVWIAKIPTQEFLASKIFVTAYDDQENVVGTSSLPYNGPAEIYQALHQFWATSSVPTTK